MLTKTSGLPTFDCKGSIAVIFSSSRGIIIVKYAHSFIHRTVASRQGMKSGSATHSYLLKMESSRASQTLNHPWIPVTEQSPFPLPPQQGSMTTSIPSGSDMVQDSEQILPQEDSSMNPANREWSGYKTAKPVVYAPNEEFYQRALSLLSENSIEINGLSQEQLNIFENQPPNLQAQSLRLIKYYGPARLGVTTYQGLDNQITQYFQPHTTLPYLVAAPTFGGSYPEPP